MAVLDAAIRGDWIVRAPLHAGTGRDGRDKPGHDGFHPGWKRSSSRLEQA
jgi:hypothetical protein